MRGRGGGARRWRSCGCSIWRRACARAAAARIDSAAASAARARASRRWSSIGARFATASPSSPTSCPRWRPRAARSGRGAPTARASTACGCWSATTTPASRRGCARSLAARSTRRRQARRHARHDGARACAGDRPARVGVGHRRLHQEFAARSGRVVQEHARRGAGGLALGARRRRRRRLFATNRGHRRGARRDRRRGGAAGVAVQQARPGGRPCRDARVACRPLAWTRCRQRAQSR